MRPMVARRLLLLGLLLVALAALGPRARAGSDPDRRWFTVVTPHFAVHSHDGGEAFARVVADYCEEARTLLGEVFDWYPRERVHVLAVDDFDAANGFASVLPHPAITIWAFPPPPDSELGNYANWLDLLVLHEYTHIVQLDHSGGLPEVVNTVFGRVWKPNNALPRWVTEGLAVWVESRYPGGAREPPAGADDPAAVGRVGSAQSEMFFRVAALAGRLPSLSELTGAPLEHPRGTGWYIYGGALFDHIARRAGVDALRRFVAGYGAWPAPFALENHARRATGKTMSAWWGEVREALQRRAEATAARVRAEGVREGVLVRGGALDVAELPRFSSDGRHLLWLESDGDEPLRLVGAPAPTPEQVAAGAAVVAEATPLLRCEGGCGRFMPTRDGARLMFATARDHRLSAFHTRLALIPFDGLEPLPRRAPQTLPSTRRAFDPTPAADGRSAWAARTSWGEPELARYSLETGEVLEVIALPPDLTRPGSHARVDRPIASADGRALYAAIHADGNRDLYRIDLGSRAFTRLTRGAADEQDPILSADERWLVYSSDRDGVPNLYALELASGVARKVTNVLGGASSPALSPDGRVLVFRAWTFEGPTLRALIFDPAALPEVPPDGTPLRPRAPPRTTPKGRLPYDPMATLLPRSWLPSVTAGSDGAARVGLSVQTLDATNRYGLALSAEWDLGRDDWTAYASLSLRTGLPDLFFDLGRYSWDRTSFVGDLVEDYREEVVYTSAQVSLPVPDVFSGMSWGFGLTAELVRGLEVGALEHTPEETTAVVPREGFGTAMNLFVGVSDTRQYARSIAPTEGVSGFFNLALREPALGGTASAFTFTFVTRAHVPLGPLGHVLSLRLGGGLSGGDPGARSVFSLGGPPRQDVLTDLLNQTSAGAVWLRGFEASAFQGTRFGMLTGEWRFPLVRVRGGLGTLPIFLEDLSAAVFSDVAAASWDAELAGDLVAGLGAELRLRTELFFGRLYDFRLGYAHGFGPSGGDQVYFLMAGAP